MYFCIFLLFCGRLLATFVPLFGLFYVTGSRRIRSRGRQALAGQRCIVATPVRRAGGYGKGEADITAALYVTLLGVEFHF